MQNYKQQFKGKKITIMGLGLLGRGLGYTKFLAECGADLIVTDLKMREQLKTSVEAIMNYELRIKNKNSKKIKFVLGEHRLEDFRNRDMIIKNPAVPPDSIYIKEARKNKIPQSRIILPKPLTMERSRAVCMFLSCSRQPKKPNRNPSAGPDKIPSTTETKLVPVAAALPLAAAATVAAFAEVASVIGSAASTPSVNVWPGFVRSNAPSTKAKTCSCNNFRPRDNLCFTLSSVSSNFSATTSMD